VVKCNKKINNDNNLKTKEVQQEVSMDDGSESYVATMPQTLDEKGWITQSI
jgi:hypothetical protein